MPERKKGFFSLVYDVVATIPAGSVMTYGQIAKLLGGDYSGRTVGFAMRAAPADRRLPCHRVVNKKGEMAPGFCFGGAELQRRLLRKEGVRFLPDGRIDMARSQVPMPEDSRQPASMTKPRKKAASRNDGKSAFKCQVRPQRQSPRRG